MNTQNTDARFTMPKEIADEFDRALNKFFPEFNDLAKATKDDKIDADALRKAFNIK